MAKINLGKLDLEELKALQKDVATAISEYERNRRTDALAAAETAVKAFGFSLAELTGAKGARKMGKAATRPKYRHPENPELTWSGRGRKPRWFIAAIEDGKTPEDLEIG